MAELLRRSEQKMAWERGGQKVVSIMNPNKFRAAQFLLAKHKHDKVRIARKGTGTKHSRSGGGGEGARKSGGV